MKLYIRSLCMHLKSQMQYKTSFFMTVVAQFLTSFSSFVGIWFMMKRFEKVDGFTSSEVMLCFGVSLMAFSLAECFFRGFDRFVTILGNGQFDRILVRPRGVILQVLCSQIDFTRLGRMLQSVLMLGWSISVGDIHWTADRLVLLFLMLMMGMLLYAALFLLGATLCFFSTQSIEMINIFTDGGRELSRYPLGIYGKELLTVFTFVVPLSLVQYYPFLYLTGRSDSLWLLFSPLAVLPFVAVSYGFWRIGIRHFKSTGS